MRENDWIVATINNPDFSNQDFKDVLDMNMDNTQLLPYSAYTSSPFITQNENFKNADGTFNETKFKDFYTKSLDQFQTFNEDTPAIDNFEYSLFDANRTAKSRIKDSGFKLEVISNPDRMATGIAGRNQKTTSPLSRSEMAQQSKIWNTAEQKWEDYSPNDISLTSNPIGWAKQLFSDPLVKATWDEEGDSPNPITGQMEHHNKGDLKLNDEGQYYYETLNGRSLVGKDVLSATDILTIDGEGINKYDFLDSDDLDKSATGTVAKMALSVAPLLLGGPISTIYSGALIAREMGKSLPMLYGMVSTLWGNDQDSTLLNTIAAVGQQLTSGTSDYAKEHTFAFENIASLIADVATQWGQQKGIANSINKLKGSQSAVANAYKDAEAYYTIQSQRILKDAQEAAKMGKIEGMAPIQYVGNPKDWQNSALGRAALRKFVEPAKELAQKNARLGADASLAYMAIISNTDVYQTMLEHGASKEDAAKVAFGSTLGMFAVDKYMHLGEMFFDELSQETKVAVRSAIKKESESIATDLTQIGINSPATKESKFKLIQKGIDFGKGFISKYADDIKNHTTGVFGKALGEGLEEVTEEVVTDLSKQLYQLAGEFSPNFLNNSGITDVGAWENWQERYLMSLLGGGLGGGLFYGVSVANGQVPFHRDTTQDELIYLIANGKTNEVLSELDKWHDKGKLGNKNISASNYEYGSDGNPVYLTADKGDSQNDYVYNTLKKSVLQIQDILSTNGTDLSDDQLFEQMVAKEQRFINMKALLKDVAYSTRYHQDFREMTKKLLNAEQDLKIAYGTKDGTVKGEKLPDAVSSEVKNNPTRLENIKALEDKVESLKKERDKFLSGEYSMKYTDKMLFAIDSYLNSEFTSMTYEQWVKANKGKTIDKLTEAEKRAYKTEYLNYKKSKQSLDLDEAFDLYKAIAEKVNPHIKTLQDNALLFKYNSEALAKVFAQDGPIANAKSYSYDEKLPDESEEDFENRDKKLEKESDADFLNRKRKRLDKIADLNKESWYKLRDGILDLVDTAGDYVDPAFLRRLHAVLRVRENDSAKSIIESAVKQLQQNSVGFEKDLYGIFKDLKPDLSNVDEIRQAIENYIEDIVVKPYDSFYGTNKKIGTTTQYNHNLAGLFNGDPNSGKHFSDIFPEFRHLGKYNIRTNDLRKLASNIANIIIANSSANANEADRSQLASLQEVFSGLTVSATADSKKVNADVGHLVPEYIQYYKDLITKGTDPKEARKLLEQKILEYTGDVNNTKNLLDGFLGYNENADPNILAKLASKEGDYIGSIDEDTKNSILEAIRRPIIEEANRQLDLLRQEIQNDPVVSLFNEIRAKIDSDNPIIDLVKKFASSINYTGNIESLLDKIHQKFLKSKNVEDFVLTDSELEDLEEASKILKLVRAYLYAAGVDQGIAFPAGHNKVMNDFAKNHPKENPDFKELPTLPQDIANMYMLEIERFLDEIDPESPMSWASLSAINQVNKTRKLLVADQKYVKAKLDFFDIIKANRDAVRFTIKGIHFDLLDGIEKIVDDNPAVKLHKIENLFYINLHKALNSGITIEEILNESKMLETLLDLSKILEQSTADLDDHISYGKLTEYDKLIYLATISGISSNEMGNFVKSNIEDSAKSKDENKVTVPLTIQEQSSRLALAHIKNPKIFNGFINYALKVVDPKGKNPKAILSNFVFIQGGAGAGKTTVIAKNASRYIASDDIWLSAPKEDQLKNLKNIIGKGVAKTRRDFMLQFIDSNTYEKLISELETDAAKATLTTLDRDISKLKASVKLADPKNAPKLIIIDEITHFSVPELQIINWFAKKHNITVVALGDTMQQGFRSNIGICNIDFDRAFTIRSSYLSISLRDVNLQKSQNLTKVSNLLKQLNAISDDDPQGNNKAEKIVKNIPDLRFAVYNEDVLNGDLITPTIDAKQVAKLHGTIAFVGDTNGAAYNTLKNNLAKDSTLLVASTKEIQGQEFDYIVVDTKWKVPTDLYDQLNQLSTLYTLMSRGKSGSIFIDNGLSNYIGQNTISRIKAIAPNLKNALDPFIKAKKALLDQLGLISNEDFDKLLKGETTTKQPQKPTEQETTQQATQNPEPQASSQQTTQQQNPNTQPPTTQNPESPISSETQQNPEPTQNNATKSTINPEPEQTNPESEEVPIIDDLLDKNTIIENNEQAVEIVGQSVGASEDDDIKINNNLLLDKSKTPIRIYGSVHLTGLAVEEEGRGKNKIERWRNTWAGGPKSDMQMLLEPDKTIESPEDKNAYASAMLNFKSVLLYHGRTARDYELLSKSIKDIIDEDTFQKGIQYKIVVRPQNETDNFYGFTGLKKELLSIDGYVYSVVAEFKNKNGEICRVTLGGLANPESYKIRDIGKLSEDDQKAFANNKENYENIFKQLTQKANDNNGTFEIDVTPQFSGLTAIRRYTYTSDYKERRVPIRNLQEYAQSHPYTVISDPYIVTRNDIKTLSDWGGNAVVFVSNDTTLKKDELVDEYIKEKQSQAQNDVNVFQREMTPRVRMIPLWNRGISFHDLIWAKKDSFTRITQIIKDKKVTDIFPFETDAAGIRMYRSLWNFRANLLRFSDAYSNFKEEATKKLTSVFQTDEEQDNYITQILRYKNALYLQQNLQDRINNGNKVSQKEVDNVNSIISSTSEEIKRGYNEIGDLIDKFNDRLSTEVRQFRLGGAVNDTGVYLGYLTNIKQDNPFYKKYIEKGETPVGIYIEPATAAEYLNRIDQLFEGPIKQVVGEPIYSKTGKPFEHDRIISMNTNDDNSLGFKKTSPVSLVMSGADIEVDDGINKATIKLGDDTGMKRFPVLLAKVLYKISKKVGLEEGPYEDWDKIQFIDKDGNKLEVNSDKILDTFPIGGPGHNFKPAYDFDRTLALAFHGTTEDVETDGLRATDAYFKHGMFTDPIGSSLIIDVNGSAVLKGCLNDPRLFLINVETDMPIFYVNFGKLKEDLQTPKQEEQLKEPQESIQTYQVPQILQNLNLGAALNSIQEEAGKIENLQEREHYVEEKINNNLKRSLSQQASSALDINKLLSMPIKYTYGENAPITLQEYLEERIGQKIDPTDQNSVYVDSDNNIVINNNVLSINMDSSVDYDEFIELEPVINENIPQVPDLNYIKNRMQQIMDSMTNQEDKQFVEQLVEDHLGNGVALTDKDSLYKAIEAISEGIENNEQIADDYEALSNSMDILLKEVSDNKTSCKY